MHEQISNSIMLFKNDYRKQKVKQEGQGGPVSFHSLLNKLIMQLKIVDTFLQYFALKVYVKRVTRGAAL